MQDLHVDEERAMKINGKIDFAAPNGIIMFYVHSDRIDSQAEAAPQSPPTYSIATPP